MYTKLSPFDIEWARNKRREKYIAVSRGVSSWLHRLTEAYKRRGQYPILPYMLGGYYQEPDDKVIAILAGCLFVHYTNADMCVDEMVNMRMLMGAHPFKDFYVNRGFDLISTGNSQNKRIGGHGSTPYWIIAKVMQSIWETQGTNNGLSLGTIFRRNVSMGMRPGRALAEMLDYHYIRHFDYRADLALLALCTADGIGQGIWHIDGIEERLEAPANKDFTHFLNLLYPNYKIKGFDTHELADMLGFNMADLWYCYYAYMDMTQKNKAGVSRYMRRFHVQIKHGAGDRFSRENLKRIEPPLDD